MQLTERKISKELVEMAINNPDKVVSGRHKRKIYQKLVGDKLLRVIAEDNDLITAYLTDKIKKYMEGE